jgi:hypothetical protein
MKSVGGLSKYAKNPCVRHRDFFVSHRKNKSLVCRQYCTALVRYNKDYTITSSNMLVVNDSFNFPP